MNVKSDPVIISTLGCSDRYVLYYDTAFQIIGCKPFMVPVGFSTDGASIPRFAWITTGTPFHPKHIRAAVIHDYLYQRGSLKRITADRIFKAFLLADGVSKYQAFKMYLALRAFGWIAWRRYRKADRWDINIYISQKPERVNEPLFGNAEIITAAIRLVALNGTDHGASIVLCRLIMF